MAEDDAAVAKLDELVESAAPLSISALTVTEVGIGLGTDSAIDEFDRLLDGMDTVPFDHRTARRATRVQRQLEADGNRIGVVDAMVAATAIERDERVLTRNVSEFRRVDGTRVTPY